VRQNWGKLTLSTKDPSPRSTCIYRTNVALGPASRRISAPYALSISSGMSIQLWKLPPSPALCDITILVRKETRTISAHEASER